MSKPKYDTPKNNPLTNKIFRKIKKESPILNLSEISFLLKTKINNKNLKNILPNLKYQEYKKLNLSDNSIKGNIKEIKSYSQSPKQNYKSRININSDILLYDNIKIKIPKLICSQVKTNSVNNLSERKLNLSKMKSKVDYNFYDTKRIEEFFMNKKKQKKVNEILKINNDDNNILNINNNREKKILNILFKKIGINNDDKIIKRIKVGLIDNKNKNTTRNITHLFKKKLKSLHKNQNNNRNNHLKYFTKDYKSLDLNNKSNLSSSLIINKHFFSENKNEKIKQYRQLRIKNMNKKMVLINDEINTINNKIKEEFNQLKEIFKKDVKEILTNF